MTSSRNDFDAAIHYHDEAVAAAGLDIWVGAEPTFTDRFSQSSHWLSEALGGNKESYAIEIIDALQQSVTGALLLRTVGRQYPDEPVPRWSLGRYQRRNGVPLPSALPKDPLLGVVACDPDRLSAFRKSLSAALTRPGWVAQSLQLETDMGLRILLCREDEQPVLDVAEEPRLARQSLHEQSLPEDGVVDDLAAEGKWLIALGFANIGDDDCRQPCMDLPAFDDVPMFLEFLACVASAADECGLEHLVWRGFPPPVDDTVAWMTLTPDPAVVEVNEAPAKTAGEFLASSRKLYQFAEDAGLAPYRLQFNGSQTDSGGGGQFTLGGPTALGSPFFVAPQLLPQLVAYLNQHPSLSYWFAPDYLGSHSQSPRADETVSELFSELQVAIEQLEATPDPQPEFIWASLSPFLTDTSGNAHRSELNIEKLWNPYLPGRGCLGLVEFRAFRMAVSAEKAASIAALLRSVVAMLSQRSSRVTLVQWGSELHDRFSLPHYLRQDLLTVFKDLDASGFGLGEPIQDRLLASDWRQLGQASFSGGQLSVEQAIEFWPLLGDAALNNAGSRLVDASTSRLQIQLRTADGKTAARQWQLLVGPYILPMRVEHSDSGDLRIMSVRFRAFKPWAGLHPGIEAQGPIELTLIPVGASHALHMTLHSWQPESEPYDGLPKDIAEARRRTNERFVVKEIPVSDIPEIQQPPARALTDYCLDLRRI